MINITFKPGLHDGELKDNPKSFPAGLVYLALQAEASDEEYSGFVSGWVRPEVAKLVKAAPELLEACKTMAEWFRREHEGFANAGEVRTTPEGEAAWRKWWEENLRLCALAETQAAAAIAKATT
jgi:hypothetical protein